MTWIVSVIYFNLSYPETNWNWEKIDTQNIHFPNSFAWGTATAAHQVEGNNTNNNWYDWEHQLDENNQPRIHNGDKSILAADHWNRYPDDIKLMKDIGVNHYRFSIEWSKIEPDNGNFNVEAIQHYRDLCDSLIKNDVTPVVTLHHFTHPIWFEKLGAFEKRENIDHFIEYSEYAFDNLKDLVPIWCTINEPSVFVSQGYFNGIFPPGKKDPVLAAVVLENLLYAHTKTYKHLKNLDGGDQAQIGLIKNIFQFDPLRRWHILDWAFSKVLNNVFTHSTLDYFKKGHAIFSLPGMVKKHMENNDAIGAMDFIGLNYYSRMHVKGQASITEPFIFEKRTQDIQTDMDYALYPEGFYKALHTISTLKKPIYVTENGVADQGNNIREIFIKRYLYALNKAVLDGLDIRGYFYWTLMDNFEWAEGYKMKFGLYEVDFKTQKRTLRESSNLFVNMVQKPGTDSRGYIVSIGDIAPNFAMEYTTGEKVTLSDLRGKVVVLQFTASWCSVCRKEMPHLEKDVWQQFKEKDLILIGIDRDEPIETVIQFQKEMGTTYPLAVDPGAKIFGLFADKNSGVTRNVVIDQKGKIVFLTRLFEKEEYNQMIEVIKSLL